MITNRFRAAFFGRMATRKFRHGADFRQALVDCGFQCVHCGSVFNAELHEPFGEDHGGWGMFQKRILLCRNCHNDEHPEFSSRLSPWIQNSMLLDDIEIEVWLYGGYDKWIKHFGLIDRFGVLVTQYLEFHPDAVPERDIFEGESEVVNDDW